MPQRRPSPSRITTICRQILRSRGRRESQPPPPCEVFINHHRIDTRKTVAGLLHHHLRRQGLRPFLDSKNINPGDNLSNKTDVAIRECKVGVAVFSPMYCESCLCLRELSLMMETGKKVVPIFCDVKPSELRVEDNGSRPAEELVRFRLAIEEAKYTVGLTFDTLRGDWPEFLAAATDAVIKNLIEVEEEGLIGKHKYPRPFQ